MSTHRLESHPVVWGGNPDSLTSNTMRRRSCRAVSDIDVQFDLFEQVRLLVNSTAGPLPNPLFKPRVQVWGFQCSG